METEDLVPFRAMFGTGKPENFFVMVSHIVYTALDEKRPASLSPAVMTTMLRDELGWQGVVVSDIETVINDDSVSARSRRGVMLQISGTER